MHNRPFHPPQPDLDGEIWKPIPDTPGYEASTHGRIRSVQRQVVRTDGLVLNFKGRILRAAASTGGYLSLRLVPRKHYYVHRLVLAAFVGPCPDGMEACHNNGDPADNRLSNLRWDSKSRNAVDTVRHGNHNMRSRTHCPRRHALVIPNLTARSVERGYRECLACQRARSRSSARPGADLSQLADSFYAEITSGV